jgi:hypothetical protein
MRDKRPKDQGSSQEVLILVTKLFSKELLFSQRRHKDFGENHRDHPALMPPPSPGDKITPQPPYSYSANSVIIYFTIEEIRSRQRLTDIIKKTNSSLLQHSYTFSLKYLHLITFKMPDYSLLAIPAFTILAVAPHA